MKKILYKLCKPHMRFKVNIADCLLLVTACLVETPYYIIGRLFSILAMFINYFGWVFLEDMLDEREILILKSTTVVIGIFLLYVTFKGI